MGEIYEESRGKRKDGKRIERRNYRSSEETSGNIIDVTTESNMSLKQSETGIGTHHAKNFDSS